MNPYSMVVAVVFLLIIGAIFISRQIRVLHSTTPSLTEIELKAQLDKLQQRVETLERIVTDNQSALKNEIDSL